MDSENAKIKEILLRENYVTQDDIEKAEDYVKKNKGSIVDYLFSSDLINKDLLGQAVAEAFQVPFANLDFHRPSQEQVLRIPQEIAQKYRVVLYNDDDVYRVMVATDNPKNPDLLADLKKIFMDKKIATAYGFPKDIEASFVHYRDPLITRLSRLFQSPNSFAPDVVNEILKEAYVERASDIHFEPQEDQVIIRFRIDGILHQVGSFLKPVYGNILNRIKIQSNLRIDEHTNPQDGAMRVIRDGKKIDLRISIVPTLDGEKIVIRILSEYLQALDINSLGLTKQNQKILFEIARKPFGMIIVIGPTGSGKTTTLYTLIKAVNRPGINITTIEDPVEYKISGVNQIQVNEQTNLTFASGLKSIIRQDPNIILVGEIRDFETAEIAVNAALTGHLLFSTFHANDASTAIPRLLEMGVEPFLISSTLELIVGQRLVRKICSNCKFSQTYKGEYVKSVLPKLVAFFPEESVTLYRGKGCQACGGTGYKGRIGIFEFIKISAKLKELMLERPTAETIWQAAKAEGSISMFEDGMDKVKSGITTLEELLRVASQPS